MAERPRPTGFLRKVRNFTIGALIGAGALIGYRYAPPIPDEVKSRAIGGGLAAVGMAAAIRRRNKGQPFTGRQQMLTGAAAGAGAVVPPAGAILGLGAMAGRERLTRWGKWTWNKIGPSAWNKNEGFEEGKKPPLAGGGTKEQKQEGGGFLALLKRRKSESPQQPPRQVNPPQAPQPRQEQPKPVVQEPRPKPPAQAKPTKGGGLPKGKSGLPQGKRKLPGGK